MIKRADYAIVKKIGMPTAFSQENNESIELFNPTTT